jgi:hypothetical protein
MGINGHVGYGSTRVHSKRSFSVTSIAQDCSKLDAENGADNDADGDAAVSE